LVSQPLIRLAAGLPLLAVVIALREEGFALREVLGQVLGDDSALGQDELLFLGRIGGIREGEANDGGLAQGVDFSQLTGRLHVFIAVEEFDVVREAEFLEQPDNALGSRLIEPVMMSAQWCCCEDEQVSFKVTSKAWLGAEWLSPEKSW
jgi:hypothetical protein